MCPTSTLLPQLVSFRPSIFQTSPAPTMPTAGPVLKPATPDFKAAGLGAWTTDDHSNIEGPGLQDAPPMSVLTSGVSSEKPSK